MDKSQLEMVIGILLSLAIIAVAWVIPITVGIRNFRRKGYSPHWMWFGIHPLFGYIAMIVSLSIAPQKQCGNCGGYSKDNFRLCPYCGHTQFIEIATGRSLPVTPPLQRSG